jgi:hypothetical protein
MKSLRQYIIETKKTYHFRVKLAGIDPSDAFMNKLENALKAYDLVSVTKAKHEPVQLVHPDFPKLGAVDVYALDIAVNYPANDSAIRNLINEKMGVPYDRMFVLTKHQVEQGLDYSEIARRNSDDPALTDGELEQADEDAQDLVGQKRVEGIKDNIKTRKYEFEDGVDTGSKAKTTNDLPQGTMSPVGTHQNQIPNPFSRKN